MVMGRGCGAHELLMSAEAAKRRKSQSRERSGISGRDACSEEASVVEREEDSARGESETKPGRPPDEADAAAEADARGLSAAPAAEREACSERSSRRPKIIL